VAAPAWPKGAEPLGPLVKAPPELAARLAFTALVERQDGERLQAQLSPGARLVSKEGDLWRWDGFTARAEAPKPAQVRLEQKTRLAEIEAEIEKLKPEAAAAKDAHAAAMARFTAAEEQVRTLRGGPKAAEFKVSGLREAADRLQREGARRDARAQSLDETIARFAEEEAEAHAAVTAAEAAAAAVVRDDTLAGQLAAAREVSREAREASSNARAAVDLEVRETDARTRRREVLARDRADWAGRAEAAQRRQGTLEKDRVKADAALEAARDAPSTVAARRETLMDELAVAEARRARSADALAAAETGRAEADRAARAADARAADTREARATLAARLEAARERLAEYAAALTEATELSPEDLGRKLAEDAVAVPAETGGIETHLQGLERERDQIGPVNLRAEEEATELGARLQTMKSERSDLTGALAKLRQGIDELNAEGRERLLAAFDVIDGHFRTLFTTLFEGGQAELRLVESEDPLEAGLEIYACPPGKRMAVMSLMSGGEQALTAAALIFAVFLANPAPICVLDEVDAPLDDANVERFCNLLGEMRQRAPTRFITITHNPLTMSRMDRLFGVTMSERGVSQLVSVDLRQAEALAAQ